MRIGTRGSQLALWQARTVARSIEECGGPACEIVVIRTSGDESAGPPDSPRQGGRGTINVKRLFVKEIEDALLDGRIEIAVHSSKDLPAALPDGLRIAAALAREDPRDALVLPAGAAARGVEGVVAALGPRARVGTSSVRRAAELASVLPGAAFSAVRGNVDTRLRKLDAGECDVLVLAAAGLIRLGLADRITAAIPADRCVPAPGQGIVAVEIADAAGDAVRRAVAAIADADAMAALVAERAVVQALGGGCQMPLGAFATVDEHEIRVLGSVAAPDGSRVIRASTTGNRGHAAATGEKLAAELLRRGAGDILASLHTK